MSDVRLIRVLCTRLARDGTIASKAISQTWLDGDEGGYVLYLVCPGSMAQVIPRTFIEHESSSEYRPLLRGVSFAVPGPEDGATGKDCLLLLLLGMCLAKARHQRRGAGWQMRSTKVRLSRDGTPSSDVLIHQPLKPPPSDAFDRPDRGRTSDASESLDESPVRAVAGGE